MRCTAASVRAGSAAQGGMKAEKLLQLAESMAAKQLQQGGAAEGYEAVMLYLHVLQEQGNASRALQVIQGAPGRCRCPSRGAAPADSHADGAPVHAWQLCLLQGRGLGPLGKRNLLCASQAEAGDRTAAAALYQQAALARPDSWAAIQGYLDCVLPQEATPTANGDSSAPDRGGLSHANGSQHGDVASSNAWQVCPWRYSKGTTTQLQRS